MEKVKIIAKKSSFLHKRTPEDYAILFDAEGMESGMYLNSLRALNESTFERNPQLLGERIYLHRHYAMVTLGDIYYDSHLGKQVRSVYLQVPKCVKPTESQISALINEMKAAKDACKDLGITAYFICDWVGDYGYSISMGASGSQLNRVIKKMREAIDSFPYAPDKESNFFSVIEED